MPFQVDVAMNVHTHDGTLVRADIPLPDLPVGHDDDGVFVVDYGEHGRQNGAARITLVKIAVR